MTWNLRISLLIVISVIFSFISMADTNNTTNLAHKNLSICSDCHGNDLKGSGVNTRACASCHVSPHFDTAPSRYSDLPEKSIHSEHTETKNGCQECHSPPACNRCHNGHATKETKNCVECHGNIPSPFGHPTERSIFSEGSHEWMKCKNCHLSSSQFNFREFKYPFDESYNLCSTCHSKQTKSHYQDEKTNVSMCVNCHNPHSTSQEEQTQIKILDIGSSIANIISSAYNFVTGNFVIFLIVLIFIVSLSAEYLKNRGERLIREEEERK
jgi:hypothetical protein